MRKLYIILLVVAAAFSMTACTKWLDISPSDIVDEEDLFKEGTGYRNALNGVYRQMSSTSLFGRELTWGMAESMAQTYDKYEYPNTVYYNMASYDYEKTDSKALIQGIWNTAYNAIANCNNIINRIESEPNSKFKKGKEEKELILGEALALRSFLHFQMLCYFAPALVKEHAGNWVPYYDSFTSTGAAYVSVENCLERCILDLKRAQTLVEPFELDEGDGSTTENHRVWMQYEFRFFAKSGIPGYPSASDIFFAFRGYRMNHMAINAILARVYSYAGKYELAAAEAQKVIDFKTAGSTMGFKFTPKAVVEGDYKMSQDLIFALSNINLIDDYNTFGTASRSVKLQLPYGYQRKFDSESDYRLSTLLMLNGSYYYPRRYTTPQVTGAYTSQILDMIPVVRLSEMHYIKGEYLASKGSFADAADALDEVRVGRDCKSGLLTSKITSMETFAQELLNETRREFVEEGLIFYYHKKYGKSLTGGSMKDAAYYFPLPETETVN